MPLLADECDTPTDDLENGDFTSVSIASMIEEASDLLPHQAILENFVHHNPWETLQHMEFQEALKHIEELSSYLSPAERLLHLCGRDPRRRAHEAIAELGAIFLDRGAAKWEAPNRERGFLYFFASLEGAGRAPWRAHARAAAAQVLSRECF